MKESDTNSYISNILLRSCGGANESNVNDSELINKSEEKILDKIKISQEKEVVGDVPYHDYPTVIKKLDKI